MAEARGASPGQTLDGWARPWFNKDMDTHTCFPVPGAGCHVCTCPSCGRVGLGFVCGSPADPDGGATCAALTRARGGTVEED